ncbi:MAG: AAA family ATPase [Bacteroidetes bacterium]|nr:MAG: AAA family ATPase [Bacteroidota bacterium]
MQELHEISNRLINSVKTIFFRSLYKSVNWENRLIEIQGARGVGKTTMMLQKAKELNNAGKSVLYISLDIPYFYRNGLFETAENFYKYGGQYLFVDEVHKYPQKQKKIDWAQEIKNIYDTIPDLFVIFSGSSVLQLYKSQGDLSRRKSTYMLNGLSFREYLQFYKNQTFERLTLAEILNTHQTICTKIIKKIKILPEFNNYLSSGYYPFFKENPKKYLERLADIINVIIETDIPYITDIANETLHKFKQLLSVIASTVPYSLNLSNISSELYITDQRTLIKYLNLLEKAELIKTLGAKVIGNKILNKPQKIYLNNTNLMYAIDRYHIHAGTLRETFFLNQLNYLHKINYTNPGDFIVDNHFTFEVGGKNKTNKQIKNTENAFLALDNIETGFANNIPLWIFGFLY